MPNFPQSGVEFVADAEQYLSTLDEMLAATEQLSSGVSGVADEIESSLDIEPPDLDFGDVELPFDEIPEEIDTTLNTEETDATEETLGWVRLIAAGTIFTLILDIAGKALEFFNAIQEFTVAPILDIEDAVARFNAETGTANDGISELIRNLHFVQDVGDFGPITDTLIAAQQQGIELGDGMEEAALGALALAKVFQDTSPTENLRTMNTLVQQGLAPNFAAAADLLAAGLQTGTNRAGDMFQTLNQFAPMFAEMNMTGEQAMSVLNSGLDAGFRATSDVARAIDTMNKNLTGAAADAPVFEALESIGVQAPEIGEQVGVDFFQAVVDGIAKHPEEADAAIEAIFGGRADKVSEAFGDLTLADEAFENLENRALDAATEIDNSLRGAIADFILWIQDEINAWLSSAEIDLPGKIEELKERIQNTLAALATGQGLPVALEMAFEAPGLANKIERLESAIGNFVIEFAMGIAQLIQFTGNTQGSQDIIQGIQPLVRAQLEFDLNVADTQQEITDALNNAMRRGGFGSDLGVNVAEAINTAIASGDFQHALDIAETIDQQLAGTGQEFLFGTFADNARDGLMSALTQSMAEGDFESALNIAEMLGEENLITAVQEMAAAASENMEEIALATEEASTRVADAVHGHSIVPDIRSILTASQQTLPPAAALFRLIETTAETAFNNAAAYVNVLVDSIMVGFGNALPILDEVIAKLTAISQIASTANATVTAVAAGAQAINTVNNTNINVNQTNNVQSGAQAASIGLATSRQVRGFAG